MKKHYTYLLLAITIFLSETIVTKAQINVNDSLALVDLYNSTNGSLWNNHNNWLTGPIISWYGVEVENQRVSSIVLDENNLDGNIPPSLGSLSKLISLDLSFNKLSGHIPPELDKLLNLSVLLLYDNQLSGTIPPELGKLSSLDWLLLGYNQLIGIIPPELGNLSILSYLDLSNNQLTGNIPPELSKLPFSGGFAGLDLSHNQLSGNIPTEFGNISLEGYFGSSLNLSNNRLTGNIPRELGNLSFYSYNNYNSLDLSYNQLSGQIPPELGNISLLSSLYLSHNKLTGNIPPELSEISYYNGDEEHSYLDLSYNQLSGTIPPELGQAHNITDLYLNNNQLSGNIPPSFFNYHGYYSLRLSYNKLEGSIPAEIATDWFYELYLDHNKLSGSIPPELGEFLYMQRLFLDHNKLSGTIPASIANPIDLDSLDLSYNRFTFDGMELIAQTFSFAKYNRQALIPIHINNNTLSVSTGGTLSNNIYQWYKLGEPGNTTINGDSVFHPTESGVYFVKVRNKIAKDLKLVSRAIKYTAPPSLNAVSSNKEPEFLNKSFSVYPNPAKDILHVKTDGNVSISLLSQSGEILLTENINKTGSINITGKAAGVYYLKNNNINAVEKISIVK